MLETREPSPQQLESLAEILSWAETQARKIGASDVLCRKIEIAAQEAKQEAERKS